MLKTLLKMRLGPGTVVMLSLLLLLTACGADATPTSPALTTTQPATTVAGATAVSTTQAATTGAVTTAPATTVAAATSTVAPTVAPTATPAPTVNPNVIAPGTFQRVFLILLENTDYAEAVNDPTMKAFAKQGALLTNYSAVTHPSYPNYLALVAGSTFGIESDEQTDLDKTNLSDLMDKAGVSWKAYAEGLPATPCYKGVLSGTYVRKHEPFASFLNVRNTPDRCARLVNSTALKTDIVANKLPQYSFYVPDLKNDGHDTGLPYASRWLQGFLPPLLADPNFTTGTLVAITFDEDDNGGNNRVYTILLGPMVKPGATSDVAYTHYDLLRTIEDNFSLGNLGREDAKARDIVGIWAVK